MDRGGAAMAVKRGRECGSDGGEVEYEKLRNERLRENQKRMEELGILSLSKSLSESVRSPGIRGSPRTPSSTPRALAPAGPARRSSRYVFLLDKPFRSCKVSSKLLHWTALFV